MDGLNKVFEDLRRFANDAIATAKHLHKHNECFKDGAINWGDLHATGCEFFIDDMGYSGFRILVEEAAPDNHELREFIQKKLQEKGHTVEVRTQW